MPASQRLKAAARMAEIEPFHVVEVFERAKQLEGEGRSVVHMEVGEPDFATPAPVIEAACAYLRRGQVHYEPSLGLPALRAAIAAFYGERYGLDIDPARVVVTAGASAALMLALAALIDPGDEVLLSDPGYPCNRNFVRCLEGRPRVMPVSAETAYQPGVAQLRQHWGAHTRAALLASPANPTGTLIPEAQLASMAEFVRERGGVLLVDEIYHGLTYGEDVGSALALGEDVFVINSFSKYFGMTGWRLGWMVAPRACVRNVEKLAQNLYICPSAPAQYAALAAFAPETIAILEARREEFRARRDYLLPALRDLGFQVKAEPAGAFYIYAGIDGLTGEDSHRFTLRLIEEAGVAIAPGLDFGTHAPQRHVRFAYTTSMQALQEGVQRIGGFLRGG